MLLRRVTQHVKQQNWFAVGVDFVIVVVGVFIGIQVSNWNEAQKEKAEEQRAIVRLDDEFRAIQSSLEVQIRARKEWAEAMLPLIRTLEGIGPPASDLEIKAGIDAATSAGRLPGRSATYVQLTAGGQLTSLSSNELQQALIRYDARLTRDAFLHAEAVKLAGKELSENPYVDRNLTIGGSSSAMDQRGDEAPAELAIRSYDLEGLKQLEGRYETLYRINYLLIGADEAQLELANDVLAIIGEL